MSRELSFESNHRIKLKACGVFLYFGQVCLQYFPFKITYVFITETNRTKYVISTIQPKIQLESKWVIFRALFCTKLPQQNNLKCSKYITTVKSSNAVKKHEIKNFFSCITVTDTAIRFRGRKARVPFSLTTEHFLTVPLIVFFFFTTRIKKHTETFECRIQTYYILHFSVLKHKYHMSSNQQ